MCSPPRRQCITLVRKNVPGAAGAEFSNTGDMWCDAVINACASVPNQCRYFYRNPMKHY